MMKTPRHALVLGMGRSGLGAARLLRQEGAEVTAADSAAVPAGAAAPTCAGIRFLGGLRALPEGSFDLAVVSPGFAVDHAWLNELRARGVPLVSELELGWSRARSRVLAITGSLGKSTATLWAVEALRANGYTAAAAGNIGYSVCEWVASGGTADWLVLEVSSFQLETCVDFRPDVALLLNIVPNHLDRHRDMDDYMRCKARIFDRTTESSTCVVPVDQFSWMSRHTGGRGAWVLFGDEPAARWKYARHCILDGDDVVVPLHGSLFDNPVLGRNAAGVAAALTACGVSPANLESSAATFRGLRHRQQPVGEIGGVRYINDSKASCLTALIAAVQSVPGPVHLIAGGICKETEVRFVRDILASHRIQVYLIGQCAPVFHEAWSGTVPCRMCGTLERAVAEASANAAPGDTIILSPGCSSFDQYPNFERRGDHFVELFERLRPAAAEMT
ncbi:MAG: UDP-N-acetylmuramoyl-L-alanine--D-glutamate ligase [Kiritimatiellia bacterium]